MTYDVNIVGTHNVVDACISTGVKHLLYTSSNTVWYRDNLFSLSFFFLQRTIRRPRSDVCHRPRKSILPLQKSFNAHGRTKAHPMRLSPSTAITSRARSLEKRCLASSVFSMTPQQDCPGCKWEEPAEGDRGPTLGHVWSKRWPADRSRNCRKFFLKILSQVFLDPNVKMIGIPSTKQDFAYVENVVCFLKLRGMKFDEVFLFAGSYLFVCRGNGVERKPDPGGQVALGEGFVRFCGGADGRVAKIRTRH